MANQACISIGINQYQSIQSLGYGMADAVAMERFFVDAAGWDVSQCLLMSDISTPVDDESTYPDKVNIDRWIKQCCSNTVKAGDLLWFFFSGYGVSIENEDYLIPIDGNPADPANTCISLRQVYQQLQATGANVYVFLDANHGTNLSSGGGIGKVTAKLAEDYQIPTFLSCQSQEFSHEASGLEHGLFTAALLEALNYHPDLNIEILESYLSSRIAELSEHHWKPVQTPVSIIPSSVSTYRPIFSATTQSAVSAAPDLPYAPPAKPQLIKEDPFCYTPPTPLTVTPAIPETGVITTIEKPENPSVSISNWAKVSVLLTTMVGAGGAIYLSQQPPAPVKESSLSVKVRGSIASPLEIGRSSTIDPPVSSLAQAAAFVKPGDATSRYQAILAAQKIPQGDTNATEARLSIEKWSTEIYQIAQSYADKKEWQKAIATAKMIPKQTTSYATAQKMMIQWAN